MMKINDKNNFLPSSYILQRQRIESGNTYEKISSLLKDISSNYEIINISLMNSHGEEINLSSNVEYYIETNPNYDRNKAKAYHLVGDSLEEISSSGYGRYIRFENDKMSTYVVLIEGVGNKVNLPPIISFSMVGIVLILGLITFLAIFFPKKKEEKDSLK